MILLQNLEIYVLFDDSVLSSFDGEKAKVKRFLDYSLQHTKASFQHFISAIVIKTYGYEV